jgi:hypothetical protein
MPQRVRSGQAGRVERDRAVVDGDDAGTEIVRGLRHPQRAPERVVQGDDVWSQVAEGRAQGARPDRKPVAVRRRQAQRRKLVAAVLVVLGRARDDHVVLDQPGRLRPRHLCVDVCADPATALAVEQRDVDDAQRRARQRLQRPVGAVPATQAPLRLENGGLTRHG